MKFFGTTLGFSQFLFLGLHHRSHINNHSADHNGSPEEEGEAGLPVLGAQWSILKERRNIPGGHYLLVQKAIEMVKQVRESCPKI